jgi:hypothetical protein
MLAQILFTELSVVAELFCGCCFCMLKFFGVPTTGKQFFWCLCAEHEAPYNQILKVELSSGQGCIQGTFPLRQQDCRGHALTGGP